MMSPVAEGIGTAQHGELTWGAASKKKITQKKKE